MATTQNFKMLPSFYQTCLQASLTQAQYLTLQILILLLQSHRTVQLERLAALFPQPITFESRRESSAKTRTFVSLLPFLRFPMFMGFIVAAQ